MSEMLDVEFIDGGHFIGYWVGLLEFDDISYEELEDIKQQYADSIDDKLNCIEDHCRYV